MTSNINFIFSIDNETVGKVINIVYAGYKIQLPDNTERIINPSTSKIVDLSSEDYENFRKEWLERKEKQNIAQNIVYNFFVILYIFYIFNFCFLGKETSRRRRSKVS